MSRLASITSYSLPTLSDLPTNTAQWTPEAHRAVLLIHDMSALLSGTISPVGS